MRSALVVSGRRSKSSHPVTSRSRCRQKGLLRSTAGKPARSLASWSDLILSREEVDDPGIVIRRVDVVGQPGGRNSIQQLGPVLEQLARTGVAIQRYHLWPERTIQQDRRAPVTAASVGGCYGRPGPLSPPCLQQHAHGP